MGHSSLWSESSTDLLQGPENRSQRVQWTPGPISEWEKAQKCTKHTDLEGWGALDRQRNSLWGLRVCPGTWWDSQPGGFFHLLGSILVMASQGIILAWERSDSFLKVSLVLPFSSLIAKCFNAFWHNWKRDSCGSAAVRKHFSAVWSALLHHPAFLRCLLCNYRQYLKNKTSLLPSLRQSNWSLNVCMAPWHTFRLVVLAMEPGGISALSQTSVFNFGQVWRRLFFPPLNHWCLLLLWQKGRMQQSF